MKRILYIARNELYNLFYSPLAWFVMVLFIVITAMQYIPAVERLVTHYHIAHWSPWLRELTDVFFGYNGGSLSYQVITKIFIFFPLITMGVMSRELNGGTMKLLYSSPVRISEIILGKFTALVCFSVALLLLFMIIIGFFSCSVFYPDYGHLAASLFGIFLVFCVYAAIGIFFSSLTSYQIVAAILTFAFMLLLSRVDRLWQNADMIRNITFYLDFRTKAGNSLHGLLNVRDTLYFVLLTCVFLAFTIIRIRSAAESISWFRKFQRYMVIILCAFLTGWLTSRPQVNAYNDTTRDKLRSITPPTRAMLGRLSNGRLKVTLYANLFAGNFHAQAPARQNAAIRDVWEPYIRYKHDIDIDFVYYYNLDSADFRYKTNPGKTLRQIAEQEAESHEVSIDRFLTAKQLGNQFDLKAEENHSFFILEYKGRKTILRTFEDQLGVWPCEDEIAAALNRLIATPPKIYFLTGHIERGPFSLRGRDYRNLARKPGERLSMINQGYDVDTISLTEKDIPVGTAALAIMDPRTPISEGEWKKILRYAGEGGNLYIAFEPDRKQLLQPLWDTLGIRVGNGVLVQHTSKFGSGAVLPNYTDTARHISERLARWLTQWGRYIKDSSATVVMKGASVLTYKEINGFAVEPLLITDSVISWNRTRPISEDSLDFNVSVLPDDQRGRFVTSLLMKRSINNRQQRIIVSSDADYLSNDRTGFSPPTYNQEFAFWPFSYFTYGQFPANTLHPEDIDTGFHVTSEDMPAQEILLYYIVPGILLLLGTIILIRRKRK